MAKSTFLKKSGWSGTLPAKHCREQRGGSCGELVEKYGRASILVNMTPFDRSVGDLACLGITKLSQDPISLAFIQKLDVVFVEEIGMMSAEQYSAVDLIYQHIRGCRLPFSGVLLIGTGDPKQLRPPSGSLLWMSPLMLTTFRLYAITEFVRMDRNGDGQKLLRLMGEAQITEQGG